MRRWRPRHRPRPMRRSRPTRRSRRMRRPPPTHRSRGCAPTFPRTSPTITEAVDAAVPGDLVLVSPGTYNEAVNVVTDEITIRGTDRAGVVLDGQFELDNGIRVLGRERCRRRELDDPELHEQRRVLHRRRGLPGVVPHGDPQWRLRRVRVRLDQRSDRQLVRVRQPRRRVLHRAVFPVRLDHRQRDRRAQRPRLLGHELGRQPRDRRTRRSATTGRAIVPNSGSYELCYPERDTTVVGNIVYSNNQSDTPAIDVAILAMGNGIIAPGGIANLITEEPRVRPRQDRHRPGAVPRGRCRTTTCRPEDEWDVTCAEQREQPPADEIPEIAAVGGVGQRRHRQRRQRQRAG